MHQEIVIAGFGGQGILLLGQMLAYAGMLEGREVTWLPSYGPEMRGGTANCTVVISDGRVGSPVVSEPDSLLVLNRPSLDKFEPSLQAGGVLVVNTSLVDREPERGDIEIVELPATELADKLGNVRTANMVMLGAYVEYSGLVSLENMEQVLGKALPPRRHELIPINLEAIHEGARAVRNVIA